MPASKHVDIDEFQTLTETPDYNRPFQINISYKKNKPDTWYFKPYGANRRENEAAASDLFRFILGKQRAAKARIATHNATQCGLFSQHNKAGFQSLSALRRDCPYRQLTVSEGIAEVKMAEFVIDDIDGVGNKGNVGLNNNNEVSRIDFDLALYRIDFAHTTYARELTEKREEKVLATQDAEVISRFYQAQIHTLCIDQTILETICSRHCDNIETKTHTIGLVLKRIAKVRACLLESDDFRTFVSHYDATTLACFVQDFFKHENKNKPETYQSCLTHINDMFTQLKQACEQRPIIHMKC